VDDNAVWELFSPLYSDLLDADEFSRRKPFLAHYTSLEAVESILKTDEIWFSNPLFMNDMEEVRFGLVHCAQALRESKVIREAVGTDDRYTRFITSFDHFIAYFEQQFLLDTYVFCLTEQELNNTDGLLSMWRGYGGNGKGAALVFDTSKLTTYDGSPLIIAKVQYGSSDERLTWTRSAAKKLSDIITGNLIPDDKVHLIAFALFERLKLFALFSKHHGFKEENEWRVVYMKDRDLDNKLGVMFHYANGPKGVEPKLRFKIAPIEGVTASDLSLNKILASILLGPSTSSPLAKRSIERMLEVIGKPELKERLIASSIPFRAT